MTFPDIGIAFRDLLLSDPQIAATVGTRIYPDRLAQGVAIPAISFFVISTDANDCLAGAVGVDTARIQVECFAPTRYAAGQLANLVRVKLSGFRGVVSGVMLKGTGQASGQQYGLDRSQAGTDEGRPFIRQDFFTTYNSLTEV